MWMTERTATEKGVSGCQRKSEDTKFHAYQESAHKFEKNDFLAVSKPNIRFLSFLALVSDEHLTLFSRILPGY
jgi:hypothetical protein